MSGGDGKDEAGVEKIVACTPIQVWAKKQVHSIQMCMLCVDPLDILN